MVGNIEAIDDKIEALKKKGLVLTAMEGLQDYFTCEIKFLMDKKDLVRTAPSYQKPG